MKGFRCPKCAQTHEMKINDTLIAKMNPEMTEVIYESNIKTKDELIQYSYSDEAICPACETVYPISTWMDAFSDPEKYFETEQLCHCGGELWMEQIPGTSKFGFVCEDCGWVKPNKTVDGGV